MEIVMKTGTLYILEDPRKTNPKERDRYVGQTTRKLRERFLQHMSESRRGRKSHKHNWIRSLMKIGMEPIMRVVEGGLVKEELDGAEIGLIARMRKEGYRLVNQTDGGEGRENIVVSEETRRKFRENMKGRTGKNAPNYGGKHSDEFKEKMRKRMTGESNPMFGTGEDRSGKKNYFFGKTHDEAAKIKMRTCNKGENNPNYGKKHSEETKRKMREAARRRFRKN